MLDIFALPLAQSQLSNSATTLDSIARTPLSQILVFAAFLSLIRLVAYPYLRTVLVHKRGFGFKSVKVLSDICDAILYAAIVIFFLVRPFVLQTFQIPSGSMVDRLLVGDTIIVNKGIYRSSDPKAGDIVVFRPPVRAVSPSEIDEKGEVKIDFIKRCVGTEGMIIEHRKGDLYVNGKKSEESYRRYTTTLDAIKFQILTPEEEKQLTLPSFKLVMYKNKLIPLLFTEFDVNSQQGMGQIGEGPTYQMASEYQFRPDEQEEARKLTELPAQPIPKGYYLFMGDNRNGSFDGRGWGLVPRDRIVGKAEFILWPWYRLGGVNNK